MKSTLLSASGSEPSTKNFNMNQQKVFKVIIVTLSLYVTPFTTVEVKPTQESLIFKPIGHMIGTVDYATLKININVKEIFNESNNVCKINRLMDEYIEKRLNYTKKMSAPNKRVINILRDNIKNMCKADSDTLNEIMDVFGLKTIRETSSHECSKR